MSAARTAGVRRILHGGPGRRISVDPRLITDFNLYSKNSQEKEGLLEGSDSGILSEGVHSASPISRSSCSIKQNLSFPIESNEYETQPLSSMDMFNLLSTWSPLVPPDHLGKMHSKSDPTW